MQLLKFGGGYIKPVWWGLLLLFILPVLTCDHFAPGGGGGYDPDGITYTDVTYSPDGKSVTIYLDEKVPVTNRQSRALSRELAIAGHDYFEVAFYTGTQYVRASWELRKDAYTYISGTVLRGTSGINYDYGYIPSPPSSLPANHGAAIIFVGKKTDKTLLGVGRLTSTDPGGGTTITSATKSITFTVAPLECGVLDPTSTNPNFLSTPSSFYTDYKSPGASPTAATTEGNMFKITDFGSPPVDRKFPKFMLLPGAVTHATYRFRTLSSTNVDTFNTDYAPGIIVAGPAEYMKKQPRYPISDGKFQYYSLRLDDRTVITPDNNSAVGVAFENPLEFSFNTSNTVSGSTFALVFQVPVNPLSTAAGPGKWYIRPSYDSYFLDLDAGILNPEYRSVGTGGAVLMGMGNPAAYSDYKLRLVSPPNKFKYGPNSAIAPDTTAIEFLITGLIVEKVTDLGLIHIEYIKFEDLEFFAGGWPLEAGWTSQPLFPAPVGIQNKRPGSDLPEGLFGIQVIRIRYIDPISGDDYYLSFPVIVTGASGRPDYSNIPRENRLYIRTGAPGTGYPPLNSGSLNGILNSFFAAAGATDNATCMVIFDGPFDFSFQTTVNAGNLLIIILAARDNVILGRTGVDIAAFIDWNRRNKFYFGTWPFAADYPMECIYIQGNGTTGNYDWPGPSYPYIVNAGGPYSDVTVPPPAVPPAVTPPPYAVVPADPLPAFSEITMDWIGTSRYFIHAGNTGRIYGVNTDDDVTVLNKIDWFH